MARRNSKRLEGHSSETYFLSYRRLPAFNSCLFRRWSISSNSDRYVIPGVLDLGNAKRVSEEEYKYRISRLKPNGRDIVYSREGERFGIAALVPDSRDICLSQRMMMFRCKHEVALPAFLMWQLNARAVYRQAEQDVIGATSPHVNVETIRNFWLAMPKYEEQYRIASYIDKEVHHIDSLVSTSS